MLYLNPIIKLQFNYFHLFIKLFKISSGIPKYPAGNFQRYILVYRWKIDIHTDEKDNNPLLQNCCDFCEMPVS